ncbi:MAG TPA: M50 family metallopeptidase [Chloroflexia bacterium]
MGGIGGTFSSISWLILVGAGFTVYQLVKQRHELWEDTLSSQMRQLAGGAAFFLLVPVGVLLHEFGHMLAAWSTGSSVLGLGYFFYWGYVEYIPSSNSPLLQWYVSLAGNLVSYALGIICILAALYRQQTRPVIGVMLMQLGILEVVQTLIFYPLISLDPAFDGDWDSIYSFKAPIASAITLVVHLLSLAAFIFFLRTSTKANWLLRGT